MSEKNLVPTRKTGAGGVAGALTVVIMAVCKDAFGYEMSAELAAAVTLLVMFATSYFVPNATPQERDE